MHCSQAQVHPESTPNPTSRWLRYLPVALIAGLSAYGLGTHHVLLVAFGLLAVLGFRYKLENVETAPAIDPSCLARGDGGSLPHTDNGQHPRRAPRVVDGGLERHVTGASR